MKTYKKVNKARITQNTEQYWAKFIFSWASLLYCTVLYCTVLCCTVLYCTVLYCTALYCMATWVKLSAWLICWPAWADWDWFDPGDWEQGPENYKYLPELYLHGSFFIREPLFKLTEFYLGPLYTSSKAPIFYQQLFVPCPRLQMNLKCLWC